VLSLAPHHPFRPKGSDDSSHQAPRVHDASRRHSSCVAARGARAATGDAGGRDASPLARLGDAVKSSRRQLLQVAAGTAALSTLSQIARALDYPTRPVTLIVPFPAGGTTDVALRALATATEKYLGQSIVVENRAGAAGTLGPANMAATAKPDGYTISQLPGTVFRQPFMTKTSFDPATDFTYIICLTGYTFGVVVRSDAPWKTFPELLAAAKANPSTITYGTPGAGTTLHITMEQIAKQQGVKLVHVPFKGNAETTTALLGGHIDAVADSTGWAPQVNDGKFRLLVSWGATRTKNWPTVPTLKEVGIDMVSNSPYGLGGPKGMAPEIVKVLHDAFRKGLDDPSNVAAMTQLDQEPFYLSSEDYRAFAMRQIAQEKRMVEDLQLRTQ
jgi:tripartite-type tricarboxylate transporter receptor subunit TctC